MDVFLNEAIETHHGVRDCANNVFSISSSCMGSLVTRGWTSNQGENIGPMKSLPVEMNQGQEFCIPNSTVGIPTVFTIQIKQDGIVGGSKKRLLVIVYVD